ncbi:hypothetical protein ONS95_001333 [Cadophora gregata]|uniref:uncharacterized protein n=1 Tax=Cadophora gregata TaxID=51156 RepID=UPI0026DAEAEF|nr:uncharacterized protein ONS95_001333 [Cadophora gregata]KAK0101854.1 hypothetical protein ONS96_005831 [Cadophora gregata f. sp. sojae]KAK0129409.1 hypothetical protein ONS95_001333 [Cadophora gregata]
MAHPDSQEAALRAPQVCSHCKSIKKGCDKRLPRCSQCLKRRAVCRYADAEEPRRSESEATALRTASPLGINQRLTSTWTSIPRSLRSRLCPCLRLSLLLINSLSDVLPPSTLDPRATPEFTTTDSVIASQVSQLIRVEGKHLEEILLNYFESIHLWLPIISRKRFHDRFTDFQTSPSADLAILLLAMRLITQHPSTDAELDQDREVLYLVTKTLFAQVQAFMPSSLYLVQTGVILSHYEHAHGMIEAAYITIGTTARIAYAVGLHNKACSAELEGSDAWLDDEEALSTWWGLVICDRTISCDPKMIGRPLATSPIRENDYLPLEPEELDRRSTFSQPTFRYFVSATHLPSVGSFGREAQATYLYDKVRFSIETGESVVAKLYHLGRELQGLLAVVMEQLDGRSGIYSGATQMLITGLYMLHQTAHGQMPDSNTPANYKHTIEAALSTLTRMVIDISYAFNRESQSFNVDLLAPGVAHIVRCAQHHILTAKDFHNQRWLEDFEQLRRMLSYFNQRWAVAGMELQRLNQTVEISMLTRI